MKLDTSLIITAFKDIILPVQENPFLSQALFIFFSTTPMVSSSLVEKQMAQSILLGIKANQNLILDHDPSKYEAFLQLLINCLKYSPLATALSKTQNVLLALLSRAYSIARYERVHHNYYI
ncbi:unnamed protein product [Lactuca saligna]|uniref:Uncharacterized protein n=1 Tax=Lactuca saligna TaxID=75948 RepID=A0AA35YUC7_LACSI|nr:unnamed protein product [Lactuca saligna]